jgi:signal transduction histidine kinase
VLNLLTNAIEFTPRGRVMVEDFRQADRRRR